MKTLRYLIMALAIFISLDTFAGAEGSGGGDDVGLEFQQAFNNAMAEIKVQIPNLYQMLSSKNIFTIAKNSNILIVEEELVVKINDVLQKSVAINIPKTQTVKINRARWKNINDQILKAGIAFHEVLSLIGLEKTGFYPISSQYVSLHGQSSAGLNSVLSNGPLSKSEKKLDPNFKKLLADFNSAKGRIPDFTKYANGRRTMYNLLTVTFDGYKEIEQVFMDASVTPQPPLSPRIDLTFKNNNIEYNRKYISRGVEIEFTDYSAIYEALNIKLEMRELKSGTIIGTILAEYYNGNMHCDNVGAKPESWVLNIDEGEICSIIVLTPAE